MSVQSEISKQTSGTGILKFCAERRERSGATDSGKFLKNPKFNMLACPCDTTRRRCGHVRARGSYLSKFSLCPQHARSYHMPIIAGASSAESLAKQRFAAVRMRTIATQKFSCDTIKLNAKGSRAVCVFESHTEYRAPN
ncbi:hypothetical protein [uncultured Campylobacter sp.]|uniref:hypothetical protein n=1 Tax=uncultured Campylobacter sp. TaxID=218934 RepID=UPI0026077FFF|nr:hypothetical protein [uncultured Campylobacter sp.]